MEIHGITCNTRGTRHIYRVESSYSITSTLYPRLVALSSSTFTILNYYSITQCNMRLKPIIAPSYKELK